MILFVTTSHQQSDLVFNLYTSISSTFRANQQKFLFICVESGNCDHIDLVTSNKSFHSFDEFVLLKTADTNFWCGSVFCAVTFISKHIQSFLDISRVVLLNCDVILNDWTRLFSQFHLLESFISYLPLEDKVARSGYNQPYSFLPLHAYPYYNSRLAQVRSFYCDVVPTRCISLPLSSFLQLQSISWLPQFLPHYGSDFIITRFISFSMSTKWLVRTDTYLTEDLSSTGFKPSNTFSLLFRIKSLCLLKSVFNWRLMVVYPFVYSLLFLSPIVAPIYFLFYLPKFIYMLFFLKK